MAIIFLRDVVDKVRNKFGAQAVELDGQWFASKREARRYAQLDLMKRAGLIQGLRRQVGFPLHAHPAFGERVSIGSYVADFAYWHVDPITKMVNHEQVIEDAKGVRTPLYRWKKKHFEVEYGLRIDEV